MSLAPEMDGFDRITIDSLRSRGIGNTLINRVEIMREGAYLEGRRAGMQAATADLLNAFHKVANELTDPASQNALRLALRDLEPER